MSEDKSLQENDDSSQKEPDKAEAVFEGIPFPQETFQKLPPELKQQILISMSSHRVGSIPNPLVDKITPEHIAKVLDNVDKEDERNFKDQTVTRRYQFIYFVISLGFLAFLIVYLSGIDKALMVEVLKLILTFLSGVGVGFGILKYKERGD